LHVWNILVLNLYLTFITFAMGSIDNSSAKRELIKLQCDCFMKLPICRSVEGFSSNLSFMFRFFSIHYNIPFNIWCWSISAMNVSIFCNIIYIFCEKQAYLFLVSPKTVQGHNKDLSYLCSMTRHNLNENFHIKSNPENCFQPTIENLLKRRLLLFFQ
jgi:hypothetical protein